MDDIAVKYARAVGGNWSADATWSTTSGGAADTTKPTATDEAVLDAASGNVTVDIVGAVARSLDCNGYTGTFTISSSCALTMGDGTAPTGGRVLRLSTGMTWTGASGNFGLAIGSTSGAGTVTITSAGKTMTNTSIVLNGGGTYHLADALNLGAGTLTHSVGTFVTNNYGVTAFALVVSGVSARTLTLGSSAVTLSSTGTAWSAATVTNLTVSANTATVTLTGAASIFNSGAVNWNGLSVVMSGSGGQSVTAGGGAFTVANFTRTGTATKTDSLSCQPFTVSGTLTLTGNSATDRLLFCSTVLGTARTITAATTSLTNVDFRDITAAGAAAWTGTSIGNALGNTGITFTTPVTRYAVATGSVSSTSVWSATSGGASGASVPLCHDTIVLNAASGAITVTNDMPRLCADLTCTGYTGTFNISSVSSGTAFFGSLTLASGMTLTQSSGTVSGMGRSSHTITSAGKQFPGNFTVSSIGGTYTLSDALSCATSVTCREGTFTTGNFTVTANAVDFQASASPACVINLGTSTVTITNTTGSPQPFQTLSGCTMNASTSTIVLSGVTATARTFAGAGKTYGTLTDQNTSSGTLTITGQNTFTTLNKTATVACTLALPTSSGCTFTNFNVNGIAGQLLTLTGDVTKASGNVVCDYLSISSSDASGGATFYAGSHSTNGGSNTGWSFVSYISATAAASLGTLTGTAAATVTHYAVATSALGTINGTAAATVKHLAVAYADLGALVAAANAFSVGPTKATSTPTVTQLATSTPEVN